jgi:hypothetical protein
LLVAAREGIMVDRTDRPDADEEVEVPHEDRERGVGDADEEFDDTEELDEEDEDEDFESKGLSGDERFR